MHDSVRQWVRSCRETWPNRLTSVAEFGSLDINGTIRDEFADVGRFVGYDLQSGPGVDIVADVVYLEGAADFDWVVSAEALEHYPQPWLIIEAAWRHLKPGGVVCITAAGPGRSPHSGIKEGPVADGEHYENIDPVDLRDWLTRTGFVSVVVDLSGTDVRARARKPV